MEVKEFIIEYFKEKSGLDSINLQVDYLDEKWLDSFGMIELVEEIEDKFNIEFTQKDFRNLSFRKVGGLLKIIKDKKNEK